MLRPIEHAEFTTLILQILQMWLSFLFLIVPEITEEVKCLNSLNCGLSLLMAWKSAEWLILNQSHPELLLAAALNF